MTTTLSHSAQIATLARAQLALSVGRREPGRRRHTVSGHCQKAVLLAVIASGGEPMSILQLASMACCSDDSAKMALTALRESGIVTLREPLPPTSRPYGYLIDWERLLSLVPKDEIERVQRTAPAAR